MYSLKTIESVLQQLDTFEEPKEWLEQYPTSSHIASRMCFLIESRYNDLNDKIVVDLGCGPCMLSIAAVLCGAKHVMSFDIDRDSLEIAQQNIDNTQLNDSIDLFQLDLYQLLPKIKLPKNYQHSDQHKNNNKKNKYNKSKNKKNKKYKNNKKVPKSNDLNTEQHDKFVFMLSNFKKMKKDKYNISDVNKYWNIKIKKMCDVCIMNPPFGTKRGNEHIDILFLLIALKMTKNCVYSLHKSTTTKYLIQFINKFKMENNNNHSDDDNKDNNNNSDILVESVEIMAQLKFDVPKMYKFHKQKSKDIQVDLLRIKLMNR